MTAAASASSSPSARPNRWLAVLRLCRIGTWFSPAADVLASAALARVVFGIDVVLAMAASVFVYGAGMVLNDFADRRVDQRLRPERPLPSGALSPSFALSFGLALAATALLLSPVPRHHALLFALVLLYDFGNKRLAWLAPPLMGTLRALNLATALVLAGPDAPPFAREAVLAAAVGYGVYITAVTVLGSFEDHPMVAPRAVAAVQAAPPIAAFLALCVVQGGFWPAPAIAALPCLVFLRRNAVTREFGPARIRRSMTWLLLGTMLYTSLLALAAGQPLAAVAIAAVIVPARWISRRIALT